MAGEKFRTIIVSDESGTATFEVIPLLAIFALLLTYAFGMFGVVHTGILQSIAARNYAFETFRNRVHLEYFRDSGTAKKHFKKYANRFHGICGETRTTNNFGATERWLRIGDVANNQQGRDADVHGSNVFQTPLGQRNTRVGVNPVWIQVVYGICINSRCEQ